MKNVKEIITVTDRSTLKAAIAPYDLSLKGGGFLISRILKRKVDAVKETFWIECRQYGRGQSREVYQVEYAKTV